MYTPPFGSALENALKEAVQGGLLQVCKGRIIQPQFFCCVSGTTVGVDKDPVAVIIMQLQACAGDAICLDYSHSWSPSSTIGTWDVDWGDGNTSNGVWPGSGSVCHPLGGYQFAGTYTVKLTVTDIISAVGSTEVEVTIVNCLQIPLPVYCGCGASGVWFSHDCGAAWENRGGGTLDDEEVYDLKASPFDRAILIDALAPFFDTSHIELWCASEIGLHKTLNGGSSWSEVELPEPGVGIGIPTAKSIIPSIYDRNEWYILAETATRVYLYRTEDDGESFTWLRLGSKQVGAVWTDVDGEATDTFDMAVDRNAENLYVATEQIISGTPYGWLRKWDGVSWTDASNKLANVSLNNVVVDDAGTVYTSTSSNRVYVLSGTTLVQVGRFNGNILNMSVGESDGLIYICGDFTQDVPYTTDYDSKCAKYGGGSWVPVGDSTTIGGQTIGDVQDIVQTAGGSVYIAATPSIPGEYDGVGVLSGTSFIDAGSGLTGTNCLFVHPGTDDLYVGLAYGGAGISGKYYNGIIWIDLPNNPGPAGVTIFENFTIDANGTIYVCGWYNQSPDTARVWRLDPGTWTQLKSWSDFPTDVRSYALEFMIDSCLYVGNRLTGFEKTIGIQRSCPTGTVYNVHLADEGLTHISSMDASAEYIYVAMLINVLDTPIIIRVYYDLSNFDQLYSPGTGTWGGVKGDYSILKRIWLFGDFGDSKVLLSSDGGDSLIDVTDGGWGASELVRPVLPSIFNARNAVAFLNDALEAWVTGSGGTVWLDAGDMDFSLHCGDRDTVYDDLVLIGRLDSGAEHLDASVDLGRNFFDADGANLTPNAPITAIQIV